MPCVYHSATPAQDLHPADTLLLQGRPPGVQSPFILPPQEKCASEAFASPTAEVALAAQCSTLKTPEGNVTAGERQPEAEAGHAPPKQVCAECLKCGEPGRIARRALQVASTIKLFHRSMSEHSARDARQPGLIAQRVLPVANTP